MATKTTATVKKTSKSKSPATIAELTEAEYNPRVITTKELASLRNSYLASGDLSGVVFNTASGVLVSGHQRIKTITGYKTRIVKTACKPDGKGTVALGHIEVKATDGVVFNIPYREVYWTDKQAEMAANIQANAGGGKFDEVKLGAILAELAKGKFDIENTGMDSWSAAKSINAFKRSNESGDGGDKAGAKDQDHETEGEFDVIDPKAMKFKHVCPKCQYQWGDPDVGGAANKFKPTKKPAATEADAWSEAPKAKKKATSVAASTKTGTKTKTVAAPPVAKKIIKKVKRT